MYRGGNVPAGERGVGERCEPLDALLQQLLHPGAYSIEGEVEDKGHDTQKGGQGGPSAGEHAVDASAAAPLLALAWFHHSLLCHAAYVAVAHVGDGGTAIQTAFLLHLAQDMFHRLALVLCQSQ